MLPVDSFNNVESDAKKLLMYIPFVGRYPKKTKPILESRIIAPFRTAVDVCPSWHNCLVDRSFRTIIKVHSRKIRQNE